MVVAMKGVYPHEELAQLPDAFQLRGVVPLKVPGLGAERHAAVLEPA
jgi:16S rRNA (guanine527-N7)-methyltransferase